MSTNQPIPVACQCGARYRARASLAGRSVKCKNCSGKIQVPANEAADALPELASLMSGSTILTSPTVAAAPGLPGKPDNTSSGSPVRVIGNLQLDLSPGKEQSRHAVGSIQAYLAAVGRSAVLLLQPMNLVMLAMVGLALSATVLLQFAGLFGLLGWCVLYGYFAAFMLNIVQDAAAGEEHLTQPDLTSGVWDSMAYPAILFVTSKFFIYLPAIGFVLSRVLAGVWTFNDEDGVSLLGFAGVVAPSHEIAFCYLLYALGLFLWPMMLLVVSVGGGLLGMLRLDLILPTIARTLIGYSLVAGCVYGSQFLPVAAELLRSSAAKLTLGQALAFALLENMLYVYGTALAMRATGLYYHHFKKWFAWSWG